jgi:hypothetical protein
VESPAVLSILQDVYRARVRAASDTESNLCGALRTGAPREMLELPTGALNDLVVAALARTEAS